MNSSPDKSPAQLPELSNGAQESERPAAPPAPLPINHAQAQSRRVSQATASSLRLRLPFRSRPLSLNPGQTQDFKGRPRHVVFSALILTALLTAIMIVPFDPGENHLQAGVPAQGDIFAPAYLRYESKVLTDKARNDAMSDPANEVWVQDSTVVDHQRSILLNNLSIIDTVRNNIDPADTPDRARLTSLQDVSLTPTQIDLLLGVADTDYQYWRDNGVIRLFDAVMKSRRVTSAADLAAARNGLSDLVVPSLNTEQKALAIAFVSPLLAINMTEDQDQTNQRENDAAAAVKPTVVTVQKGEAIVRQGELITPEAIEKLQQEGLLSKEISTQSLLATAGIVALLMALLHIYIFRNAPQVWKRERQLILVGLLVVVTVAAARLILPGHSLLPYMLPVAAMSMLIAVLLSTDLAVLLTIISSVLLGVMLSNGLSLDLPIYYFVGGLTGVFSLTKPEKVSSFARAGLFIACASFAAAIIVKLLTGGVPDWYSVGLLVLAAAFNGGVATSITYAAFSLLGTLFGITTPLQLMELAHPDQPLLLRLMREAPGTYHHSLVVSNLAERAAEMIGADALLTRVCAYYHDIGKVLHPTAFIDNQAGMSNLHDELDPLSSAQIIMAHVSDGVKLGEKYKLPRRVLDAIPQHHGTMLIKFFYYKALTADSNLNQDDFRYPGPRPQTKENAILMLADGVEATVRSMSQSGALDKMATALSNSDATESPSLYSNASSLPSDAIAEVVHKTISERVEDGQLDECDLTVRDLARIQEAFVSMLKGIYHPRIMYPEPPRKGTGAVTKTPGTEPLEKDAAPAMPVQVASAQMPRIELAGGSSVQ